MASKSRSQADAQFIDTLKMIYDYNYIKLHHWRKDIDYPHSKVKMILMKNIHKSNMPYTYNRYPERYIIANLDYSVYYNDIIWYKSADDAIYIQKIFFYLTRVLLQVKSQSKLQCQEVEYLQII